MWRCNLRCRLDRSSLKGTVISGHWTYSQIGVLTIIGGSDFFSALDDERTVLSRAKVLLICSISKRHGWECAHRFVRERSGKLKAMLNTSRSQRKGCPILLYILTGMSNFGALYYWLSPPWVPRLFRFYSGISIPRGFHNLYPLLPCTRRLLLLNLLPHTHKNGILLPDTDFKRCAFFGNSLCVFFGLSLFLTNDKISPP
ncbi:hypothetical protein EV421DRAFT_1810285 [Armillaria borealis]|uniref:Uncharacterized protein n=1 Tax=Armillaria borealis TaxID=47425 RepID=A0AA39JFJ2_9AGAR|nr:hypothetical protein EV421DRAFT_1810285 [Armillaria borealis]